MQAFPETINLEDQSSYRLSEISKIKDYFNEEIQHQQSLTNKLSKYLTILDYLNKMLTVVLTVFSSTNIFAHVKGKNFYIFLIILSVFWNNYKITTRNKVKKKSIIDYCIHVKQT